MEHSAFPQEEKRREESVEEEIKVIIWFKEVKVTHVTHV